MQKFFLAVFLISISLFANAQSNQSLVDLYNLRYERRNTIVKDLEGKIPSANKEDKILIYSLLSLSNNYLKDINGIKKNLQYAEQLLPIAENCTASAFYQYAYARYFVMIDQNDKALEHFLLAFEIFKKLKNYNLTSEIATYIFYTAKTNNQKYLQYALDLMPKIDDPTFKINILYTYANYLKDKKNPTLQDSVLYYLKTAVALTANENLIHNKSILASVYFNYGYNNLLFGDRNLGNTYMNKALELSKKYNLLSILRNYYGVQSQFLMAANKPEEAKKKLEEGYQYIKAMPYNDAYTESTFIISLKSIAADEKNFASYYFWDEKLLRLNESIEKDKMEKNSAMVMANYELNEKNEKIELLTSQNLLKKYVLIASIILIFLAMFAFYFYYKSNKLKQKLLVEKRAKIESEKEQIQKELMNSILHLEKKNEILTDVKEKLLTLNKNQTNSIKQDVFKTIDNGLLIDEDFEKFKNNFNSIYPAFFDKLQTKANQSLTQLDLKYCGFILMSLSNKEIASQMNVEPKSIRMARYRIKQKLHLNKDEDLDNFIQKTARNS